MISLKYSWKLCSDYFLNYQPGKICNVDTAQIIIPNLNTVGVVCSKTKWSELLICSFFEIWNNNLFYWQRKHETVICFPHLCDSSMHRPTSLFVNWLHKSFVNHPEFFRNCELTMWIAICELPCESSTLTVTISQSTRVFDGVTLQC